MLKNNSTKTFSTSSKPGKIHLATEFPPPVSAKQSDEVMCKQERDSHHVALYSCPQVHGGRISVLHHDLLLDAVDMHVLQLKVLYEAQPYSTLVYLGQAEEHVAVRHRHQVL